MVKYTPPEHPWLFFATCFHLLGLPTYQFVIFFYGQRQVIWAAICYGVVVERSTPIHRPPDDEDSFPVLHERELHSLHRNIPALRRRDVDTATIKQHYYPEGGWGWLVCGAAFLAHLLTSGMQLAYGLLYLYAMKFLAKKNQDKDIFILGVAEDNDMAHGDDEVEFDSNMEKLGYTTE